MNGPGGEDGHHSSDNRASGPPAASGGGETPGTRVYIPWARPVEFAEAAGPADALPHSPAGGQPPTAAYEGRPSHPLIPPISPLRAVIELILLAGFGFIGLVVTAVVAEMTGLGRDRWSTLVINMGAGTGALLGAIVMVKLGGGRLSQIGLTTQHLPTNIGLGLAAFVGTYIGLMLVLAPLSLLYPDLIQQQEKTRETLDAMFPQMSLRVLIPLMLFVALWEEVVFRGFLLTRLRVLVRSWWLVIPLGAAIFSGAHTYYENLISMAVLAGLALVMGTLLVWRRSLVPAIAFHAANNIMMFQLLEWMSQQQ